MEKVPLVGGAFKVTPVSTALNCAVSMFEAGTFEKYGVEVVWHPKPLEGFNGSGCHTNYSTLSMRGGGKNIAKDVIDVTENGIQYIFDAIRNLAAKHTEHMKVYGEDNEKRMSGEYETANYDNFTFDINKSVDRGASIRIGYDTLNKRDFS